MANMSQARSLLSNSNIDTITKTENQLEVITYKGVSLDFWVSTEKFTNRDTKETSKGLNNLIRYVKSN